MTDAATLSLFPKWLNDADSKMVGLFIGNTTTSAAPMQDSAINNHYQVPLGKVVYILKIVNHIITSGGGDHKVDIYGSATTTGMDHLKIKFVASAVGESEAGNSFQTVDCFVPIDAGDYITTKSDVTDGYYASMIGVETTV